MDIRKFVDFYEDNEQQFKDFLSENKGKTLHLIDNYLDVLKQSEDENFLIKDEDRESFYYIQLDDDYCVIPYYLKFKKEFPCYTNEYEETELLLYYGESRTEGIPLWFIKEAWDYMKAEKEINRTETREVDKYKNLVLKMMSNPKVIEDVNQLKQSADLSDEDVIKILEVIYK
ncbi:MAG TPA: hypothetical protein DDW20_03590 [Firmicutes bacterium]|nr:hypothetical protein [Bacillota bacterium]